MHFDPSLANSLMTGPGTAGKIAAIQVEHVIAKTVQRAGVRDAEQVVAARTEQKIVKRLAAELYSRPSRFRKGVRDTVWGEARDSDGVVRDAFSGKVMDRNEAWDMGHRPGYEFRKHQQSADERGLTRAQFLDEHNNPTHYRPELPASNRSHVGERRSGRYLGA